MRQNPSLDRNGSIQQDFIMMKPFGIPFTLIFILAAIYFLPLLIGKTKETANTPDGKTVKMVAIYTHRRNLE
jgi:hypothetical protein